MSDSTTAGVKQAIDEIYRTESRRVFASLVRLLRDFDLAEEALHEAFTAAVEQWSRDGVPSNPRAWLVSAGRFKAIDTVRRRAKHDEILQQVSGGSEPITEPATDSSHEIEDDRLRLIFTCCHPALAYETQVALTLREVCGLTTEQIASAFLVAPATIAQRIVRGKAKIRDAGIPYEVPSVSDLPDRLESVLSVIYLVFNEGYSASSGDSLIRADLSEEAIRLGRIVAELLPDPEVIGLLSLMLLQESRRAARMTADGDLVLLEDQDRSRWNREQIAEGKLLIDRVVSAGQLGVYSIQAAIAAVHAEAETAFETNWARIVALYDLLLTATRSPVVELNRAVAVAMTDGPQAGLELVEAIQSRGDLVDYHLSHAAKGDFCRRLGRIKQARESYQRALELAKQEPERRFLERRLKELDESQKI
jgi:RNA polymerase sigma-70 factor (ECF subfamily)